MQGILIVDDDEDDCRLVKEGLYQVGLRLPIHIVMGGAEAIQFLGDNRTSLPSLIILDLNMPGMDGLEVLKNLKEYSIPTVLYSTTCPPDVLRNARDAGAIDCIKKGTSYTDNLKFAKYIADLLKKI